MAILAKLGKAPIVATSKATLVGWAVWELSATQQGVSVSENGDIWLPQGKYLINLNLAAGDTATGIRSYSSSGNREYQFLGSSPALATVIDNDVRFRVYSNQMTNTLISIQPI